MNVFGIKNLGEYHDLYLKTDVLLLRDVFEKFISVCLEYYGLDPCHYFSSPRFISVCLEYCGLDPCHYFSSPRLSWDAMLKMTRVELELIDDMRGGISTIAKRYCSANNKYVKEYNKSDDNSFIMYFDANNLYGWAMTQYLPYGGFKWMSEEEIDGFDFDLVECDSDEGYILEVDLEYPDKLHDFHNDYPLAPEKLRVRNDMLSRYCSDIDKKYGINVSEVNKLIPNIGNNVGYIMHYRNLQLYKPLGMKVVKVHRVLKFKQSDWLKEFVNFNTEKRMHAANKFVNKLN